MTNSKKSYYRGGFQYELFNDDEYLSIDKISRQVVLDALSPFLQRIMQALDRACEKIDHMYNDNPCAFALMSNYLPLAINAEFCSNLSLIQGFRVTKVKNNAISIEVEGMKMRFWLRKFPNGKHTLRPNSRRTYLKLRGKTDDADTRPLIILGYTSTKDKLKYTGLFFTQQRNQDYLDWQIDIVEECLKQQKTIMSAVSMVADDSDDIPMTIKESALLKSVIDK